MANRILSAEPEKIEIIRKMSEVCLDGADSERCEGSTHIYTCYVAEAKKIGFNLKDFV